MEQADTDRDLLESIRRDDPGAFEQFVSAYGDRIFGFGMRVCGEREDARDVAQDTLLQAYRSLKDLRDPRALRAWLYRVITNACLMKRRKGKYEPERVLSLEELKPVGLDGPVPVSIPDVSELPDNAAVRSELQKAVREAILTLPAHYRVVLVLRDMEQLSTSEAARALDLPESTIKMRLHRARLMLRPRLEETLGGSEGEAA